MLKLVITIIFAIVKIQNKLKSLNFKRSLLGIKRKRIRRDTVAIRAIMVMMKTMTMMMMTMIVIKLMKMILMMKLELLKFPKIAKWINLPLILFIQFTSKLRRRNLFYMQFMNIIHMLRQQVTSNSRPLIWKKRNFLMLNMK